MLTGWLYAAQIATTLLAKPLMGRLSDRIGRRPQIVAGLLLAGAATALVGAATNFAGLLIVSALYGFGVAVTTSSTAALVTDLAPRERYGAAHGVFGTIMDIGHASGPVVTGLLASSLGVGRAMVVIGVVLAICAGIFALLPAGRPARPQEPAR
jgi:MFS family permease